MDLRSDKLLTGAGFTGDEHMAIRRGHFVDIDVERLHRRALADYEEPAIHRTYAGAVGLESPSGSPRFLCNSKEA